MRLRSLLLITPALLFLAVFFYLPLLYLSLYSFHSPGGGGFTLDNYVTLFTDPIYRSLTYRSIRLAVETTLGTLLLAYPAAFYIGFYADRRERWFLLIAFLTPFWIDFLLRAIAVRSILYLIGLREGYTAVLLGMIYDYLPFTFIPIYASITMLPRNVLDAAKTLGAKGHDILLRVLLPLTAPGIIVGGLMVFLMSISEYVIPSLLGGAQVYTLGVYLYNKFLEGYGWELGSAFTVLLVAGTLALGAVAARRLSRGEAEVGLSW